MTRPKYETWDPTKAPERGGMRPEGVPIDVQMHGRCVWEGCKEEGKIPKGQRWMTCPAHTTKRNEIRHALTALRARELAPVEVQVPNAVFEGTGIDPLRGPRSEPFWSDKIADGYGMCDPGTCRWVPEWAAQIANYFGTMRRVTEPDQAAKWIRLGIQIAVQHPEIREGFLSMLNLGPSGNVFVDFVTRHGGKRGDLLV